MKMISVPGKYNATVSLAQIRKGEAGNYYLHAEFQTDEGEFISRRFYLTDKAMEYSIKNLNEVFDFDGDFKTVEEQITGKACRIVVADVISDDNKHYLECRFVNRRYQADPSANYDEMDALSSKAKSIISAPPAETNPNAPF
jgi:hypothetical protein